MAINHLIVHLKETKKVIQYLQRIIQEHPERGFWMVSIAAMVVSPFLTNDGVCLLFVEPILDAFEGIVQNPSEIDGNLIQVIVIAPSCFTAGACISRIRFGWID